VIHPLRQTSPNARFGRDDKKREEQIEGIPETLRGLGL